MQHPPATDGATTIFGASALGTEPVDLMSGNCIDEASSSPLPTGSETLILLTCSRRQARLTKLSLSGCLVLVEFTPDLTQLRPLRKS